MSSGRNSHDDKSAFSSSAFIITASTITTLILGAATAFVTSLVQSGYFPEGSDSGKLAAAILAGLMFVGAGIASASYVISNAWRKNVVSKTEAEVVTAREKTRTAQIEQNSAVANLETAKTNLVAAQVSSHEPTVIVATESDEPPNRFTT
jgi:hypothetical protein